MNHPASFIPVELTRLISQFAPEAELSGSLHAKQLAVIYENRWFSLFVPKEYGGLELTLPQGLEIEESLAYADGSTGWTVTLCSGAGWFAGFLEKEVVETLFSGYKVCLAGSGKPSGIARQKGQGYEITGYWRYATGAPHATVFTANCLLEKDGVMLRDAGGLPLMASFWFTREEVVIHHNWNTTGMIATASESFEVKSLVVPPERKFNIGDPVMWKHPIYRYPFLQFAETTLAVNISGMAMHFLDLCVSLFAAPDRDQDTRRKLEQRLSDAMETLNRLRNTFYASVEDSWNELLRYQSVPEPLLQQVSFSSRELARGARMLTASLYPFCGMIAADPATEINRVWRDMHTASQHSLLNN